MSLNNLGSELISCRSEGLSLVLERVCFERALEWNVEDFRCDQEARLSQHFLLQMFRSVQLWVIMVVT
jgi:hypothetical protein